MRQVGSLILALAACGALLTAPALAQQSSPAPAAPAAPAPTLAPAVPAPAATSAPAATAPAAAAKPMAMPMKKTAAAKPKHAFSCYDYAWQSKDMQDCLAKASAKPAAAKKPAAKMTMPMKKGS